MPTRSQLRGKGRLYTENEDLGMVEYELTRSKNTLAGVLHGPSGLLMRAAQLQQVILNLGARGHVPVYVESAEDDSAPVHSLGPLRKG